MPFNPSLPVSHPNNLPYLTAEARGDIINSNLHPQLDRELITIKIVMEMPPGVNKLYIPVRTKTGAEIRKSKICREWAAYAQNQVHYQRSGQTIPWRFITNLFISESFKDGDAPIKETLDACQHGGAIENDRYGREYHVYVDDTRTPGMMLVELMESPDPLPAGLLKQIKNKFAQSALSFA